MFIDSIITKPWPNENIIFYDLKQYYCYRIYKTTWYLPLCCWRIKNEMMINLLLTDESNIPLYTEWSITYLANHTIRTQTHLPETWHVFYHKNPAWNIMFSWFHTTIHRKNCCLVINIFYAVTLREIFLKYRTKFI